LNVKRGVGRPAFEIKEAQKNLRKKKEKFKE